MTVSDTIHPDDEIPQQGPRKRSLTVDGRATSISITDALWDEFRCCAGRRDLSLNQLVSHVKRDRPGNLNKAIRLFIINERTSGGR